MHPGYGFLAENEDFAAAVRAAGLIFIGPEAGAIRTMGSKTAARMAASRAGVPTVPGTEDPIGPDASDVHVARIAESLGYPVLVKAVAGGGGKGMRTVTDPGDLAGAVRAARSEAGAAFGDAAVYLERRLTRPRHIEVQLLGDAHGTVLPFVERECSIQRRHQKVVEETPSLAVSPVLRGAMTSAAAAVARAVGYTNAGTIEFLLDEHGRFYFLEMNTRLQVEHPITEMVTGLDLVRWQIRIARGERLDLDPARLLTPNGHAITQFEHPMQRGFSELWTMPSSSCLIASAGQTRAHVGSSQCMQTTGDVCVLSARSTNSRSRKGTRRGFNA